MEQLRAEPTVGPPLARQRAVVLGVLLTLAAAGWMAVLALHDRNVMGAGMDASVPDLTMGRSAPLFLTMWLAMMVAMMFPAAAPMIVVYARTQRGRPGNTAWFTAAYLSLWVVFGLAAFAIGVGAEAVIERTGWGADRWARAGGVLLVLAGAYQLSPLKDYCLAKCRSPLSFLLHEWRPGARGALQMGLRHGLVCLGCCWLLFLVLVPLGVMNIAAMLVVAAVVFAEKALPWGRGAARVAAAGLVAYGLVVLVHPAWLPTVA